MRVRPLSAGWLAPVSVAWRHRRWGAPIRAGVALGVLYLAVRVLLRSNEPPPGELVFGLITGLLYSLVAVGLILIYRANRIINFAQGEIGAVSATLAVLLILVDHVPYLLALGVAVAGAAVSGATVEILVVRRFASAPRLVLSVATIGVALLLGVVEFFLPRWMGAGFKVQFQPPRTPFSGLRFRIDPLIFTGDSIVILVAVAAVVAGLTLFFNRTVIGMAVRAAAENAERAKLLGISVNRLSTVSWVLAAVLSSLAVFLQVPLVGLPLSADIGPSVLVYALGVAVIARMESFSTALVGGIAVGVLQQCLYYFSHDPDIPQAVMLPVLLGAMLLQRSAITRGRDTGLSSWSLGAEFRPVPPELRSLPEVVWTRFALGAIALGAALALPYLVPLEQQILLSVVAIYGIVAVSLVVLTGWAGQISLGQWGFVGVGAAVASGVSVHLRNAPWVHGDFFVALILAGLVGAAAAVVIGLPALRIQGLYLAVTTLSFGLAVQVYLLSPAYFSWLLPTPLQEVTRPLLYGHYSLRGPRAFYFFCLLMLALTLGSARVLRRSRAGRVMIAARDNERAAQSYGVSVRVARLSAFAISGFWASLAGALYAYQLGNISNQAFNPQISLLLLTVVVIGGLTSLTGAMLGTVYYGVLTYGGFSQQIKVLASGAGALVLLFVLRGGLAQGFYWARDSLLREVARRRQLVVPSLVADLRTDAGIQQETAEALRGVMAAVGPSGEPSLVEQRP